MKFLSMTILLLLALFVVSFSRDMSIINYDATHMTNSDASMSSSRTKSEVSAMYESWLVKHGKFYNVVGEKEKRFQIFKDNLRYIEEHNSGDHSYKLGLNKFADLTNEEYRLRYSGAVPKRKFNKLTSDRYSPCYGDVLPESIDWRSKGAVTPVKTEGNCRASWAFSAVGAVEGLNQIFTGFLTTLSEQQLIDCDKYNNNGCCGGSIIDAFYYIIKYRGIATEEEYPYTAKVGKCNTLEKSIVSIDGYEYVPEYNETALQKAVANQPISAYIDVFSMNFKLYDSGIFSGSCGTNAHHGIVVVGYGSENGKDYWIVKNSWGPKWGEEGYIRMERNIKEEYGKCGLTISASYPTKR